MKSAEGTTSPGVQAGHEARDRRGLVIVALIVLLLLFVGIRWLLGYPLITTSAFNGRTIEPPLAAPNFTLPATNGEPVSLQQFHDKVTLVYFGYTFCPDVCPSTLSKMSRVMQQLKPEQREQVQLLMVTVDPQRDTAEKLADYLAHFNSSFIGLVGSEQEIADAAGLLDVSYEKHAGSAASGYLVDHTASIVVLDKVGNWRLTFPFEMSRDHIVADLNRLLRE
jgi:protein SCO1/2